MNIDKNYCMSSFLTFRTIADSNYAFAEGIMPQKCNLSADRTPVHNSLELELTLKEKVLSAVKSGKVALALSGGIDSAILAKFLPKGTVCYTFQCIVPGRQVTDETMQAARYAKECALEHRIVKVYWEDMLEYAPLLMKTKGAPIHSIEVQIYKAALQAKQDGFDTLLFGESADVLYGGLSKGLSRDWTLGEWIDRYSYVPPYYVLKNPQLVLEPFYEYSINGYEDVHGFFSNFFYKEGLESYINATKSAGIQLLAPYSETYLAEPLDLERVRSGENKYLVREVFNRLYPDFEVPPKTPMPRPTTEWLQNWKGPERQEFLPNCIAGLDGDQKWLVFILEMFLNLLEQDEV